jgi:hypothetical protein
MSPASRLERAQMGDQFIPCFDGFGDCGVFVLALRRNRGTELPADGTRHPVDDFVTPVSGAASAAANVGFGAAGARSLSPESGMGAGE